MERIRHILMGFVLSALLVYSAVHFVQVRRQLREAEEVIAVMERESAELKDRCRALRSEIERQKDVSAMEELARQRLGLVLPEDRIYVGDSDSQERREGDSWIWK